MFTRYNHHDMLIVEEIPVRCNDALHIYCPILTSLAPAACGRLSPLLSPQLILVQSECPSSIYIVICLLCSSSGHLCPPHYDMSTYPSLLSSFIFLPFASSAYALSLALFASFTSSVECISSAYDYDITTRSFQPHLTAPLLLPHGYPEN